MKNSAESKKEATPKAPKAKPQTEPKAGKPTPEKAKPAKKAKGDSEPVDRLPSSIDELKASKSGLVAYLFLSGKDKEAIAAELKAAFKLPDTHAAKIARRITGRARFFQRVGELMTANLAFRTLRHSPSDDPEGLFRVLTGRDDRPETGREPVGELSERSGLAGYP